MGNLLVRAAASVLHIDPATAADIKSGRVLLQPSSKQLFPASGQQTPGGMEAGIVTSAAVTTGVGHTIGSNHILKGKAHSEEDSSSCRNNHAISNSRQQQHATQQQQQQSSDLLPFRDNLRSQLFSWHFNIFDLATATRGRPLVTVTLTLLEHYDLLDGWKIDRRKVERFFSRVESEYNTNAYHNNTHGADVTQTAAIILESIKEHVKGISKQDIFCIIVASAVHDLGHLGVNNDFLINSKHPRATTYNDKSVNEMYHISRAWEIAREPGSDLDIFSGFTFEEQKQIRKLMIEVVLATDMAIHFDLLKAFKAELEAKPDLNDWTDRSLLYQLAVHLADIANPSRPFKIAFGWAERVIQEFIEQGDQEAALGLSVSAMCNRQLMNMPKAQLGFVNIFLKPTLMAFEKAAPTFVATALQHLELTIAEWSRLEATGMLLPDHLIDLPPTRPAAKATVTAALPQ